MKTRMEVEEHRRRAPAANTPLDRRAFLGAASASAAFFASGVGLAHTPIQAASRSTSPRNGLLRENAVNSDGLSLTRLGRMHEVMAGYIDQGDIPGIVTAVSRGDDVHVEALGTKDTQRDDLSAVPGRFGWDGGYGTSAYVDPNEGLIGILLTQKMMDSPDAPPVYKDFWTSAYSAIDD